LFPVAVFSYPIFILTPPFLYAFFISFSWHL
jgi:hypothetical protein